jgi:drug/metabolite transporter (DMT)-like permease
MSTAQASAARGWLLASVAATWLVWGSTYLAIRFALEGIPPFLQMSTRFLAAGGLLLAWSRWVGRAPWPTLAQWRAAAALGALMLCAGMGGTAVAEQSISSGLVVAFIAVSPMLTAAFNAVFGVRPARLERWGMAIGLAGVLWLVQSDQFRASPAGLLAIGVACTGWCLGSVLSQHRLRLAPGAMGYASEMLCGGLLLAVLAALTGEHMAWPVPGRALLAWAYLTVFGSLVAFNAYMYLLSRTTAAVASSYAFVNPVIAMGLGVALGGEHLQASDWGAAGVVLVGVGLVLWQRRRR